MSNAIDTPEPPQLPVAFDPGEATEVAVIPDERALARQRRAARLAEARAYEQLGQRLLKFKAKKFGEVGDYIINKLGVKKVGHGTIISASENADDSIRGCDALIKELMTRNPPCDPEAIVALMQLKRDFNRQLLDSGEAHIRVDRQANGATEGPNDLRIPFPQGAPVTISVNQPKPKALPVEGGESAE